MLAFKTVLNLLLILINYWLDSMINLLVIILNFIAFAGSVQEKFMYIYLYLFNLCYIFL